MKNLFDEVHIIQEGSKDQADIDVLFDDSRDELSRVDNGLLFSRPEHSMKRVIDGITEFQADQVFKRYDIRGKHPDEIDSHFAERLGVALSRVSKKWVVGKDSKESSEEIRDALVEALRKQNAEVTLIEESTTDMVAFGAEKEGMPGIQVTSSHLPVENTGFKLMYSRGNSFTNRSLQKVEELFYESSAMPMTSTIGEKENLREDSSVRERWGKNLKDFVKEHGSEFDRTIVVDSLGGTGKFAVEILDDLGFNVVEVERENLADPPNPQARSLEKLREKVDAADAYAGLAFDLDADRVKMYKSGFIDGQELLYTLSEMFSNKVVSVDTTTQIQGENVYRTRVGDPFVLQKACEEEAEFAAEPNGHFAFPDFVSYNSGVLAGALAASLPENSFRELPTSFFRSSIKTEEKRKTVQEFRKTIDEEKKISEKDGVLFREENSTVLVRASGTSPKIRVQVESDSPKGEEILERVLENLKTVSNLGS